MNDGKADFSIGCVANLFSKQMHFKKVGDAEEGHAHLFDHLTLLAAGKLRVTVDGKARDFIAPQMVYIQAGKIHELIALEDNTVAYCIHALRDGDAVGDIVSADMCVNGQLPQGVEVKPLISDISDACRGR